MIRYDQNSAEAWESFRKGGGELSVNGLVVRDCHESPGQSCSAMEARHSLKHQTVSAQIRHLRDAGWIDIVGETEIEGRTVNLYGPPQRETQTSLNLG